ncbi:MAG TPA: hypothetical protein VLB73_03650 [Patescibacteria group bacterium]|nr:hypothetical protein [Patescibacteria group bacterium]
MQFITIVCNYAHNFDFVDIEKAFSHTGIILMKKTNRLSARIARKKTQRKVYITTQPSALRQLVEFFFFIP